MDRPSALPRSLSPARLTVLIVCIVSAYFVFNFYGKGLETYRISLRAAEIRRDIRQLEAEIDRLRADIAYYQTDDYIEVTARDKLNLVKPGDHPVIILSPEPPPASSEAAEAAFPPQSTAAIPQRVPRDPELGHLPGWIALFFTPR